MINVPETCSSSSMTSGTDRKLSMPCSIARGVWSGQQLSVQLSAMSISLLVRPPGRRPWCSGGGAPALNLVAAAPPAPGALVEVVKGDLPPVDVQPAYDPHRGL